MIVPTVFKVGLATTVPPVAAVNHTTLEPDGAVAVAVSVWIGLAWHTVWLPPLIGADGAALIVKVTAVLVRLAQLVVLLTDCA